MGECIRAQKQARIASYVQFFLALAPAPLPVCKIRLALAPAFSKLTWEVPVSVVSYPGG